MRQAILGLAAAGLMVGAIGCDSKTESPYDTAPAAKSPEKQAQDATRSVTNDMANKSKEMQDTAAKSAGDAKDGLTTGMDNMKAAAGDATANMNDQASKLLDQAVEYAKENKYDLAEKAVDQAESLPNLPESVKTRIPQVRKQIESMKASAKTPADAMGK